MPKEKGARPILLGLIGVGVLGVGLYFLLRRKPTPPPEEISMKIQNFEIT